MRERLTEFISQARWFGGKGRGFTVTDVRELPLAGTPSVSIHLVAIEYADGGTDLYQLPLVTYPEPQDRLHHALVMQSDQGWVYDALHDREANALWLEAFAAGAETDTLVFHRLPGHELDTSVHSTLFSGEQSNSSVAFGEDSMMKVFRRVTPGINPDIEIHRALTESGSDDIAHLYGWLEAHVDGDILQLAMLQQFLRTASDGWELALASVRNLFAEADLHADEVGGDFAAESHRLGLTVAGVHELLRDRFPTGTLDPVLTAARMRTRLDEAVAVAPELGAHVENIAAIYDRLAALDTDDTGAISMRIHGDLHLGQTLRTTGGWKIVDFEGEPVKSLAERVLPDSPWRDVAGMLRSFDYAARGVAVDLGSDEDSGHQQAYRGDEWVARNIGAFLDGYTDGAGLDPVATVLCDAYVADKAVYEVVYEARNRPTWIGIPLGAIERLGAGA